MSALKSFLKTTILGGVVVLLPVAILVGVFLWVLGLVKGWIHPLTVLVTKAMKLDAMGDDRLVNGGTGELLAVMASMLIIVTTCFVVGLIIRTSVGRFVHGELENRILRIAPGYNLVKETVLQFLGNRPSPFSSVALVQIFENDTLVTAFVTERHDNGWYSVFVPTGPNPTSGNIYHVKPEFVHHVTQPVEDVMRSIISCGAGSSPLLKAHFDRPEQSLSS